MKDEIWLADQKGYQNRKSNGMLFDPRSSDWMEQLVGLISITSKACKVFPLCNKKDWVVPFLFHGKVSKPFITNFKGKSNFPFNFLTGIQCRALPINVKQFTLWISENETFHVSCSVLVFIHTYIMMYTVI